MTLNLSSVTVQRCWPMPFEGVPFVPCWDSKTVGKPFSGTRQYAARSGCICKGRGKNLFLVYRHRTRSMFSPSEHSLHQMRLRHLMQRVINHSTDHRGQVALTMRQLGAEPLATDFHVFLLE